jgi:hypothetical protein
MIRLKKLTNYQKNIFLLKQMDDILPSFQFLSSYIIFFLINQMKYFYVKSRINLILRFF